MNERIKELAEQVYGSAHYDDFKFAELIVLNCLNVVDKEMRDRLAQPQRPWVGLTDEEINAISDCGYMDFYKAINAKLKEKNK